MQAWKDATNDDDDDDASNKWSTIEEKKSQKQISIPDTLPILAVLPHPSEPAVAQFNDRHYYNSFATDCQYYDNDGAASALVGHQKKSPEASKYNRQTAKSLATKAVLNAQRRANSQQASMQEKINDNNNNNNTYFQSAAQERTHQQTKQYTSPYAESVAEAASSPDWPSTRRHMAVDMPDINPFVETKADTTIASVRMPDPSVPSFTQQSAAIQMPLSIPDTVKEPPITLHSPPGVKMPTLQPAMAMPEPSIPIMSVVEMPIPQVASTFDLDRSTIPAPPSAHSINTPLPPPGVLIPDSTYDPASLQPPEWTDTQTPATAYAEEDMNVLQRVKSALQQLPPSTRAHLGKEEMVRIVLEAMEEEEKGLTVDDQQASIPRTYYPEPVWSMYPTLQPNMMAYPYGMTPEQHWPVAEQTGMEQIPHSPLSANDWYQINGGGVLPSGWTAQYDDRSGLWYYINNTTNPITVTWQDPRLVASLPLPPPRLPSSHLPLPHDPFTSANNSLTRQDADWLAGRFETLQVGRQHQDGARGPVAAEIAREKKEAKDLEQAIQETKNAIDQANQAANKGQADQFQKAQEAMVKARGKLDRLTYESQLRSAMIPPSMKQYQGVTRGFDVDSAFLRPRMYYTDSRIPFIPPPLPPPPPRANLQDEMTTATSFSGKFMARLFKAPNVSNNMQMPTAYSLPPGAKYKASAHVPTPYSIPEVCFAWDMLLRNQRDPNKIPIRY